MIAFDELLGAARRAEVCLASLPGLSQPLQERTQQLTDLIASSTAYLLQERAFEDIAVQDIADFCGCSIMSIYRRFQEKTDVLMAVNLVILAHYEYGINAAIKEMNEDDFDSLCDAIVSYNANFYRDNCHFIVAAGAIKSGHIFDEMNRRFSALTPVINAHVVRMIGGGESETLSRVEFGSQLIHAVLRDQILCGHIHDFHWKPAASLLSAIIRGNTITYSAPLKS